MTRYGQDAIEDAAEAPLEVWTSPGTAPYSIHIEHPEFTALCPRSGYPDFGTIVIDYVPGVWVAELKSIKLYINSFRDRQISHEAAIQEVFEKFSADVGPRALRVIGDFRRRGGIKTVVVRQEAEEAVLLSLLQPYGPTEL